MKELYYYLDAVPSYAYARMLYKLPQAAYPYEWLIEENARRRGSAAMEFELIDTGIFDDDRYFDVEIEYAKADVDDVLMRVTVHNRGPEPASIHILPQVWFRNTWSWSAGTQEAVIAAIRAPACCWRSTTSSGPMPSSSKQPDRLLFCDNETNFARLFGDRARTPGLLQGCLSRIRCPRPQRGGESRRGKAPRQRGSICARYRARGSVTVRLRLRAGESARGCLHRFRRRLRAAHRPRRMPSTPTCKKASPTKTCGRIQRQAFAGMLWNKQFYDFNVREWLDGDPFQPPPPESRKHGRNRDWRHLVAADIIVDAGQVGISLVRRLGPRLPLRDAFTDRSRFRQGAARAALRGAG